MNDKLKKLYQSVILHHNKYPYNFEKRELATFQIEAYNPLCGDKFILYLDIKEDRIAAISFHGHGCAISKSATSVLAKHIEGKTIKEVLELCRIYQSIIQSEDLVVAIDNEELSAFEAAKYFPARVRCATLSWEAIDNFLKESLKK